jgi:hypothetical protein
MEQIALFVWPIQVNEEDGRGSVWSNGVEVYSRVDTPWGKPGGGF